MKIYSTPLKSMESSKFNAIPMNSCEFRWSPVKSGEVRWSPVNFVFVLSESGRRRLFLNTYCQTWCNFIFVMFRLPLRLAAGAFSRLKIVQTLNIIQICVFIVVLPWIRPQAPFSDWTFCKNIENHDHHKAFCKTFWIYFPNKLWLNGVLTHRSKNCLLHLHPQSYWVFV